MKISRRDSYGPEPFLRFAEALVAYVRDEPELERICTAIWPEGEIYKGHTHWRVMPEGQTMHHPSRPAFYVDLMEADGGAKPTSWLKVRAAEDSPP